MNPGFVLKSLRWWIPKLLTEPEFIQCGQSKDVSRSDVKTCYLSVLTQLFLRSWMMFTSADGFEKFGLIESDGYSPLKVEREKFYF